MFVYILNVALIIIFNMIIKNRKNYVILVCLQLFLVLALRDNRLGVDLEYYCNGYYYIKTLGFFEMLSRVHLLKTATLIYPYNFEGGYVVLNWIISFLGFSFHFFLMVCAFINIYSIGKFVYKFSKDYCISFIIFCTFCTYVYFFGILRQSLALSFFLLALVNIDKSKIKSTILFILAFTFHRSVLLTLPIILLYNRNIVITKNKVIISLIAIFPFVLSSKYIYKCFHYIMIFFKKYRYIGSDFRLNNLVILIFLVLFITVVSIRFYRLKDDKVFNISMISVIIALYFSIIGCYNEVLGRAIQYYIPFLMILISYVFDKYKKQKPVIIIRLLMILCLTSYMIYYIPSQKIDNYTVQQTNFIFD